MNRKSLKIDHIPAVLVFEDDIQKAQRKGTILFFHGLSVDKYSNLLELESMAQRGFLAVGVDNWGHGERIDSEYQRLVANDDGHQKYHDLFLDSIVKTAQEVPHIIDYLVANSISVVDSIGICGVSMGGMIAYRAVALDKRIKVATPIIATPGTKEDPKGPIELIDQIYPCALLSQTAADDDIVPPGMANEFHQLLVSYYREAPDRLSYREFPGVGHNLTPEVWSELFLNVLNWFEKYLPANLDA